uniref:Uncharacterized protein n=1 Tax=Pavo cristatus TaxID=9049 RepID=A0A8C9EID8_PAVCR
MLQTAIPAGGHGSAAATHSPTQRQFGDRCAEKQRSSLHNVSCPWPPRTISQAATISKVRGRRQLEQHKEMQSLGAAASQLQRHHDSYCSGSPLVLFWVVFWGALPCWHSSPHPAPWPPHTQIPITELLFLCHKGVILNCASLLGAAGIKLTENVSLPITLLKL